MRDGRVLLAIESSCDETAAAVVRDDGTVLSSVVASQFELHQKFGGVVPEIASRAHVRRILPVIDAALQQAGCAATDLSAVAVTTEPGLVGSLLVGLTAAFLRENNQTLVSTDFSTNSLLPTLPDPTSR